MKNTTIYILGHRNPDTDSICSSIAYTELKKQLGYKKVIPGRLGSINRETKYILDYFDVPVPQLIEHVRTQISDVDYYETSPVFQDVSMGEAWKIMMETRRRMLPVVDRENEELIGVLTLGDISRINMQIEKSSLVSKYKPTIKNMVSTFDAKVLAGDVNKHENTLITDNIIIAMSPNEMLNQYPKQNDVIITRASKTCAMAALNTEAKYIFLIGAYENYESLDFSNISKDRIVFVTEYDVYSTIKLLNHSVPVSAIMSKDEIICFKDTDFLVDVRKAMLDSKYRNFTVVNEDNKVLGTLTRRHAIDKNKKKVIILDHNEWTQTVHGLDEAEVLEIIDHHRVGDVQTGGPILFRNEPVGSTCTIIAKMYFENDIDPSKQMAGIMLSGIISDTLLFRSPTCTETDTVIAKKLADIAQIDVNKFGIEILQAGASLKGRKINHIINTDFKEYEISNIKLFISQVFTADLKEAHNMKDKIIKYMNNLCENNNYDFGGLMVTDILGRGSEFLFVGDAKEIAEKAFNVHRGLNMVFLPKVVSRKKQIIPPLSEYA